MMRKHFTFGLTLRLLAVLAFGAYASASSARAQLVEVGDGGPGPFKAPHLTVELTALAPQVAVGGQLQAGLVITIEEHWHVYWINAGDSGGATGHQVDTAAQYYRQPVAISVAGPPASRPADGLRL